ncbi:MAG: methionine sulfoxide reductase A [Parcubacteria group bacterium Gr01-1014_56]|nr:MAG: methionine sulfoxide reductase A [Parcubacteria group bacterium Gr01-1014_56]
MDTETIVLGGGCFWCTEAVFGMLKGITSVEPGYAGPVRSAASNGAGGPTYEEVSTGKTPYIEVIKIEYNPDQIAFEEILQVFFETHDPTTPNRQGNDVGPQYHSAVFYMTQRQKEKTEHYIKLVAKRYAKPIVTIMAPLDTFYKAEDYHQKYYENHKDAGYCVVVIDPKIEKVQTKFANLLKE